MNPNQLQAVPRPTTVERAQRRAVGVLSAAAGFGGVAISGSIPAGSLLTASIADNEAVAGLAQTAGVLGAAIMALPLARDAIECDLELVGLIIFRNDLREDSPATIAKLRVSDCV